MRQFIAFSLLFVAIIHLLPVLGVLGAERLAALYGLSFAEPNLLILMRHRAVLFGLLGIFLAVAAFRPAWQGAAFLAGFVSVSAFLAIAWTSASYNAQIGRVVSADLVALVMLALGAAAWWLQRRRAPA